jgi:hypothetical protein
MTFRLLLAAMILLVAPPTWADQQEYVSKSDAERALALVKEANAVRTFCAPCNEKVSVLLKVGAAEISEVSPVAGSDEPPYWMLSINDQSIDLAYAYVPVRSGFWLWRKEKWRNVARILSLSVSDVPEFLSESQMGAPGEK